MATENKTAIVTGAASGIGRATAERLLAHGWSIVAADRDLETLEAWTRDQDRVVAMAADVSRPSDNEALVAAAVDTFGGLTASVLNAGIATAGATESLPLADFERTIDVNLLGTLHGIRAAIPALRQSPGASIVVTASVNGLGGDQSMSAYSASKFGVIGLVRSVCREIGFEGIRINAVCPGITWSGMTDKSMAAAPHMADTLAAQVPLGRWAESDEVASVIEFLLSPAASYVHGVALPVDGGASTGTGIKPPARSKADLRTFDFD